MRNEFLSDEKISIQNITKIFGSGETATQVLKALSLDIAKGSINALLGPSGSGKSTFLTILGTLMRPSSGAILMKGQDITHLSERQITKFRNQHIGFVFQFHHLLPDFTAMENVMFPSSGVLGFEASSLKDRAKYLLDRVGLSHRLNYRANQLSGGQKQRVAIARALMNEPYLLLADEPTGNLDQDSADQVMDLLLKINDETKMTCVISTHSKDIAARCPNRIEIVDGRLK
jgi:lipoprotein-releasing system ATP-binding protein